MDYTDFENKYIDHFDYDQFIKENGVVNTQSYEMLIYNIFYRNNVLRRIGDFNKLWNVNDLSEYPLGSLVHIISDNFLMNKPVEFVPDVDSWPMTRNPYRKFIYHVTEPPAKAWVQNYEDFILPQQGVIVTLLNYKRKYQQFMRTCNSISDFPNPNRSQVQSIISYNSLYRARIFGLLRTLRRFNYVFTHILNEIALFPTREHFIPIPVGSRQFDRSMFLKSFKGEYNRTTVRYPDDPWYLFCMNLLGFVHSEKTSSIFENIPENMWKHIHFVLYTNSKMLILRLDHLKEFNGAADIIIIRLIKQLNMLAESSVVIPDMIVQDAPAKFDLKKDDTLPEEVDVNTPFTDSENENKAQYPKKSIQETPQISQNAGIPSNTISEKNQSTDISGSSASGKEDKPNVNTNNNTETVAQNTQQGKKSILKKNVVNPVDTKRKIDATLSDFKNDKIIHSPIQHIAIDNKWLEPLTIDENKTQNVPEFKEPISKKEEEEYNKQNTNKIDAVTNEYIEQHTELTEAQKQRAKKQAVAYKDIKVGDTTIGEIIDSTPDTSVNENTVDCVKNDVADPSMLNSSVNNFETDYMKKLFNKDLVSTLSAFNKVGMFLIGLKAEDCSDPLNKSTKYTATYEDIHHKTHTINFILPDVDDRGYCLINGTYYTLKKQRVPLPICKVSNIRVTLNSDYNKYLVERNTTVAHSFVYYVDRIFKSRPNQVKTILGSHFYDNKLLPYEYSTIARKYSKIILASDTDETWELHFDYNSISALLNSFSSDSGSIDTTLNNLKLTKEKVDTILSIQDETKSVFTGLSDRDKALFMKLDGSVIIKDLNDEHYSRSTMIDFLCDVLSTEITQLSEWTDFKLLNTTVPTIFALCYRFGLTHILNYTKCDYRIYDKNVRFDHSPSDIVIVFSDKKLVIPRAPLVHSLLFAGLNNFDLKKISIDDMDSKDIYYDLIQSKHISVHNLKGIDNFFDYFVDPITADVLNQMKEPTEAKDLLIRATELLSTEDHKPAASSTNFRFRSYERLNSAVYKVLSRAHATFVNKAIGATNKFSISDYEVKQLIAQDQLMENVDFINPINDIKYQAEYAHGGFGGRQSIDTFMVDDRQFPDDGTGIISEATVDSSKTGYIASMSTDPTIVNMRGMTVSKDPKDLKPTQVLSPTAILVPGVTQDDKHII